jgi:transposase InsO family protein
MLFFQVENKSVPVKCRSPALQFRSGSQYASHAYQAELKKHGMVCSMSRKGNCWDNPSGGPRNLEETMGY